MRIGIVFDKRKVRYFSKAYLSKMKKLQRFAMGELLLAGEACRVPGHWPRRPQNTTSTRPSLPYFYTTNGNEYRSASGAPGPKYWQNRADYLIRATLNEQDTTISGEVSISYTNNSPDKAGIHSGCNCRPEPFPSGQPGCGNDADDG